MKQFDGQLYRGQLFAGRLFRGRQKQPTPGGVGQYDAEDERLEFLRAEDESLLFALVALVASRRLH